MLVRAALLLSVFVVALLGSGCHHAPDTLRVGTNVWPGYELLYLAREQGYYDRSIKLVELTSASDVMDALRLGQLEAGALTLDEVVTLQQQGVDLVVVLVFNISLGADVMLVRPGIQQLSDLRGRTIALETTAVGALMLHGALTLGGLTPADVTIRHLALGDHLRAYQRGDIDAMITFEPYTSALLAAGAQLRFDSSAIPGQIVDVLAIRREVLEQHDGALRQLLSGFFRAHHDLQSSPDASLAIINRRLKMHVDEIPLAYAGLELPDLSRNRTLLQGNPSPIQTSAGTLANLMHQQQLMPHLPALDQFTSARWLPEAL